MMAPTAHEADTLLLPGDPELERALSQVLAANDLTLVSREPNVYRGAFPSEVISCNSGGRTHRLLVKYGIGGPRHTGHGYWGDMRYEGWVYTNIVARVPVTAPRCHGVFDSPGGPWLVLDFVDGTRLGSSPRIMLADAGRWLGEFHRLAAEHAADPMIVRWDADFFSGWATRAREFIFRAGVGELWVSAACDGFIAAAGEVASIPATVAHGEFYPANVLVSQGAVYPIDWQSAAAGPGEIDLASLLENWGDCEESRACTAAYVDARWPAGAPAWFERALALARVYWPLRWLGDDPDWTASPRRAHYLDELRSAAIDAGLMPDDEVPR